jgi:hypothetical protein
MKITSVEMHPENSLDFAVFSLQDPTRSNPYNVKNIDGLDADAIMASFYQSFGNTKMYTLSMIDRQIVIQLRLNPDFSNNQSYSDLRDDLYKKIFASRTGGVQLKFKTDAVVMRTISGFISKFESANFDKTPEVKITILCDDPMFEAPNPTFPSLGNPSDWTITDSKSTAPHGFLFEIDITANVASLRLQNPIDATWSFEVTPSGGFLVGDKYVFDSRPNSRLVYIVRNNSTIYLADKLTPGSLWPIIFPGDNRFSVDHPGSVNLYTLIYYETYWGL